MSTHAPRLPDPSVARQRGGSPCCPAPEWAGPVFQCAILAPIFDPGAQHAVWAGTGPSGLDDQHRPRFPVRACLSGAGGRAWPKGERSLLLLIASTLLALFVVVFLVGEAFFEGRG